VVTRPTFRFLFSHAAHFVSLGGGAGLAPVAPGTAGTLVAFPLFYGASLLLPPDSAAFLLLLVVLFFIGVATCARTGAALGVPDHSSMVWDEIVAFMLILAFTPPGYGWQALAFFAFRAFDVLKPPPIRHVDRRWKGGFGVMFDDMLAAFYTLLVIAIVKRVMG
jgi:phosphatidylglycerophosphatase A